MIMIMITQVSFDGSRPIFADSDLEAAKFLIVSSDLLMDRTVDSLTLKVRDRGAKAF